MTKPFSLIALEKGIRYFLISFTDLFGVQRAKLVPAASIDQMGTNGAGFAGFAAWLDMTPADPDILAIPDYCGMYQLPWLPEVAWMPADLYTISGQSVEQAPRWVLKRVLEQAKAEGYTVKTGVECEYFLLSAEKDEIGDPRDRSSKPCYDQQSLMRRYDLIKEICEAMLSLGWGAYQNDHEDANGQFEMNWTYDDALITADRHAFFKYMVKSMAERSGFRATFMPKPFNHLTGNGCHTHLSVWDSEGKVNLFHDSEGELGLSPLAYNFIAGVLYSGEAICALSNPTINSYKRINAPVTNSGATWSPNTITYSGNNRTHALRIPDAGRFEFRLSDGAANPYLLPAALIAAGLEGIKEKRDPGPRYDNNNYSDPLPPGKGKKLPSTILEALSYLETNTVLSQSFGDSFIKAYVKLKRFEWSQYHSQITPWELENTLDC